MTTVERQLHEAERARRRRRFETRIGVVHRTRRRPGGRLNRHPHGKADTAWKKEVW
jgi:hypothetical protein